MWVFKTELSISGNITVDKLFFRTLTVRRTRERRCVMYAKVELTRRVFKLWRWTSFVTDEFFVGPFQKHDERDLVMAALTVSITRFLADKPYVVVSWKELERLPKGETA